VEGESRYGRISRDLLMRPDRGRLPYSWQWAPSYAAHIKEGHAGGTETNVCRAHTMPPHIQQTDRSPCATEVRGRPHYLSPPQSRSVVEAMEDEMRSISTNRVWDLEEISKGAKTVGCNGFTRQNVTPKRILKDLRHDSWLNASHREKT
jgi:hypothetical protein